MIVETVKPREAQRFRVRCAEAGCIGPVNNDAAVLDTARAYAQAHADKWRHVVEIEDTTLADAPPSTVGSGQESSAPGNPQRASVA